MSATLDRLVTDAACIERRRVDTSAAFFLSIEFQRTGFLVHKLYRASYGRMPRRAEFLPDARQAARGVVVGTPGWEKLLDDNTRAFVDEWVTRPDFKFNFDQLTDAQFIDRLTANAGFVLPFETRNAYLAALADGRQTRAQVLRSIVEDADFSRKEFGPAFVLMQYFGYLQRAEMVKAFINSDEYRARFCGQ
ncbi:MAG: hypothetical protein QOC99_2785 [Acidobacteriota bacterium]|jgi:hypothetical protein|nr:hypothetical protein [Acidobacteriota bacterium]